MHKAKYLLVSLVVAGVLLFPTLASAKKINVVTATTDLAALAREVGGDRITVESIAKGYQDPHFVEAKPSFLLKLQKADLLVVVGLRAGDRLAAAADHAEPAMPRSRSAATGYLDMSQFAQILEIPTGPGDARDGRRASAGQSALLARSGERPPHGQGARATSSARCDRRTRPTSQQRYADFDKRLTDAEKRWDAEMAPYQGPQGGHLSPLLAELLRAFRPGRGRTTSSRGRAFRRRPPHARSDQHDEAREHQADPGRAVLRPADAQFDRAARPAARCWCCCRRWAATRKSTNYFQLFDYDINLLVERVQASSQIRTLDGRILHFCCAPFVASLILTGIHAYLGVHVVERGVIFVDLVAGADRGARRDHRGARRACDPHGRGVVLDQPGVHVHRRGGLLDHRADTTRAYPAGGHHRHLLRGGVGGGDSGDEQVRPARPST